MAEHLRNDFELFDMYQYLPIPNGEKLCCPIAAFLSEKDPKVGPRMGMPNLMEDWADLSTHAHMTVDVFPGITLLQTV